MAYSVRGQVISFKSLDASIPAYRVVFLATNNTVDLAETSTALGFGISADSVSNTGQAIPVILNGIAKAECGASVSAGSLLTWQTATGMVVESAVNGFTMSTTGLYAKTIGIALEKGVGTNAVISILVQPNFISKIG